MDATELAFAGIARQAELIAAGEVSSRELVQTYLDRIERLDKQLNAFRVIFAERALTEADQAQGRVGSGDRRPLLGVPIAIKDDVDVAGEATMLGSAAHGPPAQADAEVVRRLRAAGAIVIGKTNVPELLIFPFTESERFGVSRNPWDLSRTPGGSSGGSGAAVAAGLVGAALGSDGGGSVRIPAACCGVFGLKTQRGRISLAPRREAWYGLSVNGPLTRRVRDAALFLDVASGTIEVDADSAPPPPTSFAEAAARRPEKLRIAVSRKMPPTLIARLESEPRRAFDDAAAMLRGLGHDVVEEDPAYGLVIQSFLARYLRGIHQDAVGMARSELLESRTRGMSRIGAAIPQALLRRARASEGRHAARVNSLFERYDLLMTPALATLPVPIGRWAGQGALRTFNGVARFVPYNGVWNYLGNPAASVPVGQSASGLPLAVQFVARPNDEATLLSLAAQLEEELRWPDRRPPLSE
jgi:amidase